MRPEARDVALRHAPHELHGDMEGHEDEPQPDPVLEGPLHAGGRVEIGARIERIERHNGAREAEAEGRGAGDHVAELDPGAAHATDGRRHQGDAQGVGRAQADARIAHEVLLATHLTVTATTRCLRTEYAYFRAI